MSRRNEAFTMLTELPLLWLEESAIANALERNYLLRALEVHQEP